mgnify:CR=1 FL=1
MMLDSLIRKKTKKVWAVKMADRICNLQEPPKYWTNDKKINYKNEAQLILRELKNGNKCLANRLKIKINEYANFIE